MVIVYHTKQLDFGLSEFGFMDAPKFPDDFEKVAEVDADDLDVAFELTNSIMQPWVQNKGVKTDKLGCRSTSVGDVLELNGKFYRCAMFGWDELKASTT